jgi:hypothetical protein
LDLLGRPNTFLARRKRGRSEPKRKKGGGGGEAEEWSPGHSAKKQARLSGGAAALALTAFALAFLVYDRARQQSSPDHDGTCHGAGDTCPAGFTIFGEPVPCYEQRHHRASERPPQGCFQWLGPDRQHGHGDEGAAGPAPFASTAQLGSISYSFGGVSTKPGGGGGLTRTSRGAFRCTEESGVRGDLLAYTNASGGAGWVPVGSGNDTAARAGRWPRRRAAPATWTWESAKTHRQQLAIFGGYFANCEVGLKWSENGPHMIQTADESTFSVGGEEGSGQWDDWLANRVMAGVDLGAIPASGDNPLIGTQPRDLWSLQPWAAPSFTRPSVCVVRMITNKI